MLLLLRVRLQVLLLLGQLRQLLLLLLLGQQAVSLSA
jgi:hypothetical protein